ncbi:hypothetical protein [Amycolatopsis anabasis]|nr:hypothetical protein [Amycolatopsis anabasis]
MTMLTDTLTDIGLTILVTLALIITCAALSSPRPPGPPRPPRHRPGLDR